MFEHATNIRFWLSLSPEEKLLGRWAAIYPSLYTGLLLNSENKRISAVFRRYIVRLVQWIGLMPFWNTLKMSQKLLNFFVTYLKVLWTGLRTPFCYIVTGHKDVNMTTSLKPELCLNKYEKKYIIQNLRLLTGFSSIATFTSIFRFFRSIQSLN